MTALTQAEHNAINAREYPGTREMCRECDQPTGNAGKGDGSLYCPDDDCGLGPFCWGCYDIHCPYSESSEDRHHTGAEGAQG